MRSVKNKNINATLAKGTSLDYFSNFVDMAIAYCSNKSVLISL